MKGLRQSWLLILIIVLMIIFFASGLNQYVSFASLQKYYLVLQHWTSENFISAIIVFMAVYILAVAISIPGAVFLTLLGGFLFGVLLGTLLVVVSATIGATLLFLAVRLAMGEWMAKKAGRWIERMRQGFQENALSYLLILRLIPLFPFWVVNIVPALLGVDIRTYMVGTFFGIIPGSLVYVSIGNGLGHVLEQGQKPDLGVILSFPVLGPLLGLALLALLPILYRKIRGTR